MPTKKLLTGPIKSRKARNKTTASRRTTGILRPARTGPAASARRQSARPLAPSPPHLTDEEVAAAAAEEEIALKNLRLAVKGANNDQDMAVTAIAERATEYIGELEDELLDAKEALAEAEVGREEAERALEEEMATGEEAAQQHAWSHE